MLLACLILYRIHPLRTSDQMASDWYGLHNNPTSHNTSYHFIFLCLYFISRIIMFFTVPLHCCDMLLLILSVWVFILYDIMTSLLEHFWCRYCSYCETPVPCTLKLDVTIGVLIWVYIQLCWFIINCLCRSIHSFMLKSVCCFHFTLSKVYNICRPYLLPPHLIILRYLSLSSFWSTGSKQHPSIELGVEVFLPHFWVQFMFIQCLSYPNPEFAVCPLVFLCSFSLSVMTFNVL